MLSSPQREKLEELLSQKLRTNQLKDMENCLLVLTSLGLDSMDRFHNCKCCLVLQDMSQMLIHWKL
jgi:hypothetical protein